MKMQIALEPYEIFLVTEKNTKLGLSIILCFTVKVPKRCQRDPIASYIHFITPVFSEGLGRGVFRSHVIGGEVIVINRAQILTPSCY